MIDRSSLRDRSDSFGWISIALHWATAAVIIAMWFIGKSIASQPLDQIDARRTLHIALGLSSWLLIAGRVAWRFIVEHPRVVGQSRLTHVFARRTHYLMLVVTSAMLLSGPALAWALSTGSQWVSAIHWTHRVSSTALAALVILHILGALKHLMFHDDETIVRMLWPRPKSASNDRQSSA